MSMRFVVPYTNLREVNMEEHAEYPLPFVKKKALRKLLNMQRFAISVVGTLVFGMALIVCMCGTSAPKDRDSNNSIYYRGNLGNGVETAATSDFALKSISTYFDSKSTPLDTLDDTEKKNMEFMQFADEYKGIHMAGIFEDQNFITLEPTSHVALKINPTELDDVIPCRLVEGLRVDLPKQIAKPGSSNVKQHEVSSSFHLHADPRKHPLVFIQTLIGTHRADEQLQYEKAQATSMNDFLNEDLEYSSGYLEQNEKLEDSSGYFEFSGRISQDLHNQASEIGHGSKENKSKRPFIKLATLVKAKQQPQIIMNAVVDRSQTKALLSAKGSFDGESPTVEHNVVGGYAMEQRRRTTTVPENLQAAIMNAADDLFAASWSDFLDSSEMFSEGDHHMTSFFGSSFEEEYRSDVTLEGNEPGKEVQSGGENEEYSNLEVGTAKEKSEVGDSQTHPMDQKLDEEMSTESATSRTIFSDVNKQSSAQKHKMESTSSGKNSSSFQTSEAVPFEKQISNASESKDTVLEEMGARVSMSDSQSTLSPSSDDLPSHVALVVEKVKDSWEMMKETGFVKDPEAEKLNRLVKDSKKNEIINNYISDPLMGDSGLLADSKVSGRIPSAHLVENLEKSATEKSDWLLKDDGVSNLHRVKYCSISGECYVASKKNFAEDMKKLRALVYRGDSSDDMVDEEGRTSVDDEVLLRKVEYCIEGRNCDFISRKFFIEQSKKIRFTILRDSETAEKEKEQNEAKTADKPRQNPRKGPSLESKALEMLDNGYMPIVEREQAVALPNPSLSSDGHSHDVLPTVEREQAVVSPSPSVSSDGHSHEVHQSSFLLHSAAEEDSIVQSHEILERPLLILQPLVSKSGGESPSISLDSADSTSPPAPLIVGHAAQGSNSLVFHHPMQNEESDAGEPGLMRAAPESEVVSVGVVSPSQQNHEVMKESESNSAILDQSLPDADGLISFHEDFPAEADDRMKNHPENLSDISVTTVKLAKVEKNAVISHDKQVNFVSLLEPVDFDEVQWHGF